VSWRTCQLPSSASSCCNTRARPVRSRGPSRSKINLRSAAERSGNERRIEINTGSFIAREPFFATSTLTHETSHALQHELQQAVNQRLKDGTHRLVVFGRDAHGQLVPVDGRDIDQHFKERRLPAAELQRIQSSTRRENDLDPGGTAPTAPHSRAEP
jgi:hypothetical protein